MRLIIFEDSKVGQLFPVALTRAVFELKTGITSLEDKIKRAIPASATSYFVRDYIEPTFKKRHPGDSVNDISSIKSDDIIAVNGRCLFIESAGKPFDTEGWMEKDGELVYAKLDKKTAGSFSGSTFTDFKEFVKAKTKKIETGNVATINYPWDLINNNPKAITDDFKKLGLSGINGSFAKESAIYGPKELVYIGAGAEVHPFVCLDTRGGPVIIDEGAEIHPFTRIEGPSYIGKKTMVLGAKIREGCSIGPVCRIGGEVEESIFHAYSNKFHDGFIGHAYVGEWINLGALTTNSDLKNDYGNVSVIINGRLTDSGSTKVGAFIGDHTKTSINTMINTGTHIGALCLVLAGGLVLPKYLPTGSWYINNCVTKGFGFKKLIGTAQVAMSRRKVAFTPEDEALLKTIHDMAKTDREFLIAKGQFTG